MSIRGWLVLPLVLMTIGCGGGMAEHDLSRTDSNVSAGPAGAGQPGVRAEMLVRPDELAEMLGDRGLVVLHVGADANEYDAGHIPGSVFVPISAYAVEADGLANELPPVEHLDSVFEVAGVSNDSRIVVYGAPLAAARAYFTLDYLGMGDRTALLNGGLAAWRAAGHPLSTERVTPQRGAFDPRPRDEIVVSAGWVHARLDDPKIALIDARPPTEFTGETPGAGIDRPGHIPGAANLFWQRTIESPETPTLLPAPELRRMYEAAGASPETTVVTYCRTGGQASFAYFVARYLGYDTKMYDGSFLDWSRRDGLPVER